MKMKLMLPISLLPLLLAGCAAMIPDDTGFTVANNRMDTTTKREPIARSALLAGLTDREIESIKKEAAQIYIPIWQQIARRSRYVRTPLLATLKAEHAPEDLQMIPVVESGYNPYAVSEVGAAGLWQLMPETASDLRINSSNHFNGRRNIIDSSRGAARFLLKQHDRFASWPLALAAYHLGPNAVQRRINRHPWRDGDGLRTMPLPPITKYYIRHILGLIALQQEGEIAFPAPYSTERLSVQTPVDLAELSRSSGLPANQLFRFNPELELVQYFDHKRQPLHLRVSATRMKTLQQRLPKKRSKDLIIRVARGETLKQISRRYHVSVYQLARNNHDFSSKLRAGQKLRIPASAIGNLTAVKNPLVKPAAKLLTRND